MRTTAGNPIRPGSEPPGPTPSAIKAAFAGWNAAGRAAQDEGAAHGQQAVTVANQGNRLAIGQMVEQDGGVGDVIMMRPPHGALRVPAAR